MAFLYQVTFIRFRRLPPQPIESHSIIIIMIMIMIVIIIIMITIVMHLRNPTGSSAACCRRVAGLLSHLGSSLGCILLAPSAAGPNPQARALPRKRSPELVERVTPGGRESVTRTTSCLVFVSARPVARGYVAGPPATLQDWASKAGCHARLVCRFLRRFGEYPVEARGSCGLGGSTDGLM